MSDYLYYRWAGRVLRHREGDPTRVEMVEAQEWVPAPSEAVNVIAALDPDDRSRGGWCARLSQSEGRRMVEALGATV